MYEQWCSSQSELVLHCHEQMSLLTLFPPEIANVVASQVVMCIRMACGCQQQLLEHASSVLPASATMVPATSADNSIYRSINNVDANIAQESNLRGVVMAPTFISGAPAAFMVVTGPGTVQLEKEDQVAWLMQVINYALAMPLQYLDVIRHAVHIYCSWLRALLPPAPPNDQSSSNSMTMKCIPKAVLLDPNRYARDIIYSLVNVFVRRRPLPKVLGTSDKKEDASRKDDLNMLQKIMQEVLNMIERLSKESVSLSPETWQCLLHFCLASCHHMLSPVHETNDLGEVMSEQLMQVLFTVWLQCTQVCFPKPGLWRAFTELSQTWRHRVHVFRVWYNVCSQLTARVLQSMYAHLDTPYPVDLLCEPYTKKVSVTSTPTSRQNSNALIVPINMEDSVVKECWIRILHLLGNPTDVCHLVNIYQSRIKPLPSAGENVSTMEGMNATLYGDIIWTSRPASVSSNTTSGSRSPQNHLILLPHSTSTSSTSTLITASTAALKPERLAFIFYCGVSYVALLCDAFLGFHKSASFFGDSGGNVATVCAGHSHTVSATAATAATGASKTALPIQGKPGKSNKMQPQAAGASPPEMRRTEVVTGKLMQAAGKVSAAGAILMDRSRKKSQLNPDWQTSQEYGGNVGDVDGDSGMYSTTSYYQHGGQSYSTGPTSTGAAIASCRVGFGGSRENLFLLPREPGYATASNITKLGPTSTVTLSSTFTGSGNSSSGADVLSAGSGLHRGLRSVVVCCSGLQLSDVSRPHGLRPEASSLLNLFGSWLFEAAVCGVKVDMNNAPIRLRSSALEHCEFQFGRAEACGVLCRIFCTSRHSGVEKTYLTRFYTVLYYGLAVSESHWDPHVLSTILYNSVHLMRVDLEGVYILIPRLLAAVHKVLDNDLKSIVNQDFLSPVLLRRAAIHQLLSFLCISCQFRELSIKSLVPVEDRVDDAVQFSQVRSDVWNLLLNLISNEKDPTNLQMTLGAALAMVEDYFCEEALHPKFKPYIGEKSNSPTNLFNLLVLLISTHIRQSWMHDLSTTFYALEVLCGLVQMKVDMQDLAAVRRCVRFLCEFIHMQCHRDPKEHSRFLHSIIVVAYHCLNTCVVHHSHILDDPACLESLLNTIELGLTGTPSNDTLGSGSTGTSSGAVFSHTAAAFGIHKRQGSSGHHQQHNSATPLSLYTSQQGWPEITSSSAYSSSSNVISGMSGGNTIVENTSAFTGGQSAASSNASGTVNRRTMLHHRSAKRQQPASKRVQHAAECLLACLMEQAGAHPTPAGPMVSQATLVDEVAVLQHLKRTLPAASVPKSFRYYWVDPGLLLGLLEVTSNVPHSDAADAASVFIILRGPHGRQAWYFHPRRFPTRLEDTPSPQRPHPHSRHTHIVTHCMEHRLQSLASMETVCVPVSVSHVDPQRLIYRKHPMENCMPPLESTQKDGRVSKDEVWLKKLITDQSHVLQERNDLLRRAREKVPFPNPALDCKPMEHKRDLQTARLLLCHLGYLRVNTQFFLLTPENLLSGSGALAGSNAGIISGSRKGSYAVESAWSESGGGGGGENGVVLDHHLVVPPGGAGELGGWSAQGPPLRWPTAGETTTGDGGYARTDHWSGGEVELNTGNEASGTTSKPTSTGSASTNRRQHPVSICALDSSSQLFYNALHQLDAVATRCVETLHCFFMAAGQREPANIVANMDASNVERVPKGYLDLMLSLGYPVHVKTHLGWGGTDSWLGDVLGRAAIPSSTSGSWDGCEELLYYSDFSWELAIVCPSSRTWLQTSASNEIGGSGVTSQLQRQSLYLPFLMRLDQLESVPTERGQLAPAPSGTSNESRRVASTDGVRGAPGGGSARADLQQQQPGSASAQPTVSSSYLRVGLVWVESRDDLEQCPEVPLLQGCLDLMHAPSMGTAQTSDTAQLPYLVIFVLPLRSGLYRVELRKSVGKSYDAGPLCSGMVVSSRCLASLVRQTVQNVTRRRRLELDSLHPPHVRRARKIDEIRLHHCTQENSLPDLLLGLFHQPMRFTEPRF